MHALAAFDDTALQALLETLDAVGRDINAVPDDLPPPRRAGRRRSTGATAGGGPSSSPAQNPAAPT
jgi:hypothetical protein